MDIAKASEFFRFGLSCFEARIASVQPLAGGISNLTYLVTLEDGAKFVLRTPPKGSHSGNAHNMIREAQLISSIKSVFPQVPTVFGFGDYPEASFGQFMIMSYLEGHVMLPGAAYSGDAAHARALSTNFVATLAQLHDAPPPADSGDVFGDPTTFVDRQVAGWSRRFERIDPPNKRYALRTWLSSNVPAAPETPSILHNEFKFDNLVFDPSNTSQITGVLDWELAALGDPFFDLGNALTFWIEADDPPEMQAGKRGPTDQPGMMTREEIIDTYCAMRGLKRPDNMNYYLAVGMFRLGVAVLQIHMRMTGSLDVDGEFLRGSETLFDRAEELAGL